MEVQAAIDLIHGVIYKPGWLFKATDHTNRYEGTISVEVTYPALDSGSRTIPYAWRTGYSDAIPSGAHASFPIIVSDTDRYGVYRRLLSAILDIEEHEAREFLRTPDNGEAPFHPHTIEGMMRWGNLEHDMQFGLS